MKQITLIEYLKNKLSSVEFHKATEIEVSFYAKTKNKSSSAISIDRDDGHQKLTSNEISTLLFKYLNKEINELQLEYILNYIEFAGFDIAEELSEKLFELSTPELFGPIDRLKAIALLKKLK